MRVLLFTGKGGVGKTTTAAATAVRAARAGVKTLVMSTDAAHSLGDALGTDLASPRGPVEVEPGLFALQLSATSSIGPSWRLVQEYLLQVLDTLGVDPVVAEELTSLPGAEEVAALVALGEQAESGPWDLVVVDCAPSAETLRLLALPEALAWHLDRLLPGQRSLIRTLRPVAVAAAGVPLPDPTVLSAVSRWQQRLREVQRLLTGPETSVRLVLTPERVVIAESRRTWTSLALHGFVVDGVVVNRVFPSATADPWRTAWNDAQQAGLREVRESFAGLCVAVAPYLPAEPVGPHALAGFAAALEGGRPVDDLLEPVAGGGLRVEPVGGGFSLRLSLPLVTAGEVSLQRRGEELLLEVGGHRRVLALPSALQRCRVTGAAVRDGQLEVGFEPDEAVWRRG